jgi:hypothetical protein
MQMKKKFDKSHFKICSPEDMNIFVTVTCEKIVQHVKNQNSCISWLTVHYIHAFQYQAIHFKKNQLDGAGNFKSNFEQEGVGP